jgi:hypothetical protein
MAYLATELLPRTISFHRVGGETFNTSVVVMASGQEQRNANWLNPRRKYTCSLITPATINGLPITQTDYLAFFQQVQQAFITAQGKLNSFDFYDPLTTQLVPVRFDTDELGITVEPSDVAGGFPIISWNNFVLIEVRPPNY